MVDEESDKKKQESDTGGRDTVPGLTLTDMSY